MKKTILLFAAIIGLMTVSGCAELVFVSDRDNDLKQIFKMNSTGGDQSNISTNATYTDSYPDVSPNGEMIVYISTRTDDEKIVIREIDDTDGVTEMIIRDGSAKKIWPRWSCQQDLIAFAEFINSQAKIFIVRADQGSTPGPVTNPGVNQSDSAGHDFFDNGNKIVFSRSGATGNTYDLYYKNIDGIGSAVPITPTSNVNEVLPVISHNGNLLAYLSYVMLAPGWSEVINVVDVGTWTPFSQFTLQPPIGGRRIGAIAFSADDKKLYVSTKSADVSASPDTKKKELFSVKLDGTEVKRLTNNSAFDSYPSAISRGNGQLCTRCVDIQNMSAMSPSQEFVYNSVVFKAANYSNGNPANIQVKDYCPSGDGAVEVVIGWSKIDTGAAEYATINFPFTSFGDGPSEVEITGCHYYSDHFRLNAYDKDGNLVSTANHTAGQGTTQTLTLSGGKISRIHVIGAEIGLGMICYRR